MRELFETMFFDDAHDPLKDRIVEQAVRSRPEAVDMLPLVFGWDARNMDAALASVDVPVQSTYVDEAGQRRSIQAHETIEWLELVSSLVVDVEIAVIPGAGHFTMAEKPEEVNSSIARFVNRRL